MVEDVREWVVPTGVELDAGTDVAEDRDFDTTAGTIRTVPVRQIAVWSELGRDKGVDGIVRLGCAPDVEGGENGAGEEGG